MTVDQFLAVLRRSDLARSAYRLLRSLLTVLSPELNTRVTFRLSKGRPLNLANPRTYNEKISWLKLNVYNHSALVRQCADKYLVREYVSERGCPEILNELYGVYSRVEDVPWAGLPDKFVLKWNVGAGGNLVCADRSGLDIETAERRLSVAGRRQFHFANAEMQYKGVPRRLLCERFIETPDGLPPIDYKIGCYNGVAKHIMVCLGRGSNATRFYHYDRSWNRIDGIDRSTSGNDFVMAKPDGLDAALRYAEILSQPFPYVRADFYLDEGRPIFGELTFTPAGGIDSALTDEGDELLGRCIVLPRVGH